jgi:N-acylglucosamine-6-phosphate 2-epimerase
MNPLLRPLAGGLIVSCQAAPGSPMDQPDILAAFAMAAQQAGAVAIRANHGPNIAAVSLAVDLPVIGIRKREVEGFEVYITPEWRDVEEVNGAGARIIALDATDRARPGPEDFAALTERIHAELGALVVADISTYVEGMAAAEAGADIIATTMSGYTPHTVGLLEIPGPDLVLVDRLATALGSHRAEENGGVPVICEGRVHTPAHARAALDAGAYAVVAGTAITAPTWIAGQFVQAMKDRWPSRIQPG